MSTFTDHDELHVKFTATFDLLCEIAAVYHAHGRSAEAMQVLSHSLQLAVINEPRQHRLKLLLVQGRILAMEYVLTNANKELMFASLHEAKQMAEGANDRQAIANALGLLGMAHYFVELNSSLSVDNSPTSYEAALTYQKEALQLREAIGDTRGISESTFLIGNVYERRQQNEAALACYTKALEIADQFHHLYEKTEPFRHFAFHALQKGELEQALNYALQALSLRQESGFRLYQPLDHLLLSDIYLKKGDIDSAVNHTQQASALAEEMGYSRAIASSLLSLGDILTAQHEKEQATAKYKKALLIAEELQIPIVLARAKERLKRLRMQ